MIHSVHVDHLTDAGDWKHADPIRTVRVEHEDATGWWLAIDDRGTVYRRATFAKVESFLKGRFQTEPNIRIDWAQVEEARAWAAAWAVTRVRQQLGNVVPFRRRETA